MKSLVCDTPAKSFLLNVKGHTGYNSCTKCKVRGEHKNFKTFFPGDTLIISLLRTNLEYKSSSDENFHQGSTPFVKLHEFDFIKNIPLDYMHVVCLGIVKKLLTLWHLGKMPHHIQTNQFYEISGRLEHFSQYTPVEFGRKPRSMTYYKMWKATEFRQFLLYTGFAVMHKIVEPAILLNFTSLLCAIRIFSSNSTELDFGHSLIEYFWKHSKFFTGLKICLTMFIAYFRECGFETQPRQSIFLQYWDLT